MSALTKLRTALEKLEEAEQAVWNTVDCFPVPSKQHGQLYGLSEDMIDPVATVRRILHYAEMMALPCACPCENKEPGPQHYFSCPRCDL